MPLTADTDQLHLSNLMLDLCRHAVRQPARTPSVTAVHDQSSSRTRVPAVSCLHIGSLPKPATGCHLALLADHPGMGLMLLRGRTYRRQSLVHLHGGTVVHQHGS